MRINNEKLSNIERSMKFCPVQLSDLPDEILVIIFKRVRNIEVLHSFVGVNKRLHTIVLDPIFTRNVTITAPFNDRSQLPDEVIDRFCYVIIREIHHKIERLDVEFSTMRRILCSADYPKLAGLGVYGLALEAAKDLFDGKSFVHFLTHHFCILITVNNIDIKPQIRKILLF